MRKLKRSAHRTPGDLASRESGLDRDGFHRCSLPRLELADEWRVRARIKCKWPGLGPITGISEVALKRKGFSRLLSATDAAQRGIRPLPMNPADACFHIPELVAGLEWRLRYLVEHPAQARYIDGVRVVMVLGSLITVQWPSGRFSAFAWEGHPKYDTQLSMFRMPPDQVVLQGIPWRWLWLERLMQGFEFELRPELVRLGKLTAAELQDRPQAFESYMRDLTQVMKHRLRAMPAYRSMRQRIAAEMQLDPVALDLAHRIADAPAQLGQHVTMLSSYNRAVEHKALLLQVRAETPDLFGFYAGMLEDEEFPTEGEPLQRLRNQLHDHFGGHGPYRLLLRTNPRRFVLMRRFVAHLQHENYRDWLRLLHGLSPYKPIPEWLLLILVSQFGNERQRVHLYARRFWSRMSMWAFMVRHWLVPEQPSEADLADIGQVAMWIVDGPDSELDRRQRQQGWPGLVERARAWLENEQRQRDQTPLPLASQVPVRQWGDWALVPLTTQYALWQEGTLMGHCLGRYNGPKPTGSTWFASLQHQGKRVLTCQFDKEGNRHQLVTALGRFNAKPAPDERRMLSAVLRHGTPLGAGVRVQLDAVAVVGQVGVAANDDPVQAVEIEVIDSIATAKTQEVHHAA